MSSNCWKHPCEHVQNAVPGAHTAAVERNRWSTRSLIGGILPSARKEPGLCLCASADWKNSASKGQQNIFWSLFVSPQELTCASFLLSAFHQVIPSHGLGSCACLGINSMSPAHSLGHQGTGFADCPLPDTLITHQYSERV